MLKAKIPNLDKLKTSVLKDERFAIEEKKYLFVQYNSHPS